MNNKYLVIITFITALLIPRDYAFYFFPPAVLYLMFLDIHLFCFLRRISFLLFVIILLIVQPMVIGEKDFLLLGIKFSTSGFYNGLIMIFRAVVMIPAINYLSKTAGRKKLQSLFAKLGLKNYDEILDHSQKLFPLLKEKTKEFFTKAERKNFFNPIELSAQLLAFLIKASHSYTAKTKEENVL